MTVILIVNVAEPPPALDPVTMYVVEACSAEGVPLTTPVVVLKLIPLGSDGVTANEVAPPAGNIVGVKFAIDTPFVKNMTAVG